MKTILLIDDDESLRSGLRRTLVMVGGFKVLEAARGQDVRKHLANHSVDLIITDMLMPEEDGVETIIFLRKKLPDVPIIAISGGGRIKAEDCLKLARGVGADITLAKPFSSSELLDAVKRTELGGERARPNVDK